MFVDDAVRLGPQAAERLHDAARKAERYAGEQHRQRQRHRQGHPVPAGDERPPRIARDGPCAVGMAYAKREGLADRQRRFERMALDHRAGFHRKLHAPVAIGQQIIDPRGGGGHRHFARLRQELRLVPLDPGGGGKARQRPVPCQDRQQFLDRHGARMWRRPGKGDNEIAERRQQQRRQHDDAQPGRQAGAVPARHQRHISRARRTGSLRREWCGSGHRHRAASAWRASAKPRRRSRGRTPRPHRHRAR